MKVGGVDIDILLFFSLDSGLGVGGTVVLLGELELFGLVTLEEWFFMSMSVSMTMTIIGLLGMSMTMTIVFLLAMGVAVAVTMTVILLLAMAVPMTVPMSVSVIMSVSVVVAMVVIVVVTLMEGVHHNQVEDKTEDTGDKHDFSVDRVFFEQSVNGFVDEEGGHD